jgi:4-alpha-glucanotransferase
MASAPPPRDSGILLHPTSLPGAHGIGDLGDGAYRWLDFLVAGGQQLWQVMPLGPPGFGNSPYAARSAFAGNPLLISLDRLVADGLLGAHDLADQPDWPPSRVDFGVAAAFKLPRLRRAYGRFAGGHAAELHRAFETFIAENAGWLDDYALFMALREEHGGAPWNEWERGLVQRDPATLTAARTRLVTAIEHTRFVEFLFRRQWQALRHAAHARGIRIIGDIPIFVAHDSADVWAHQDLFALDADGNPTVVAGVPPDYFSPTGQRWGNPLYRWDRSAETGHRWWIERFRATLAIVDLVRIDHFRGFESYWEVPAAEETALNGRWAPGPGEPFFRAVTDALGPLPVIVEDLGLITEEVHALRRALGYPGMKVLQFAFGDDATNPYLPHNYDRDCVVYTGTHDNDTTEGWFAALAPKEQARVIRYAGGGRESIGRTLIRLALGSVARMAIVPLQDVLGLGSEARMNLPGWGTGNWNWQATPEQIAPHHAAWLGEMTVIYGRR